MAIMEERVREVMKAVKEKAILKLKTKAYGPADFLAGRLVIMHQTVAWFSLYICRYSKDWERIFHHSKKKVK